MPRKKAVKSPVKKASSSVAKRPTRRITYKNYAELTANSSGELNKTVMKPKVPIYKQQTKQAEPVKQDQYEFDSDGEKTKRPRKRRKKYEEDSNYEEKITGILKKIMNRVKERKGKETRKPLSPIKTNIIKNKPKDKEKGKVVILSNVIVNQAQNKENTILDQIFSGEVSTNKQENPWRLEGVQRNPHFIEVKSNNLPSILQDPVLDYTVTESLEERQESNLPKLKKSPVQKSILKYISSSKHFEPDKENIQNTSLFNYEEFESPVKKQKLDRSPLRLRNLDALQSSFSTPLFRDQNRKTLPVLDVSAIESSKDKNKDLYFGFDESNEEEIQKDPLHKPLRLELKPKPKSYPRKKVQIQETVQEIPIEIPEASQDTEVALFEDPKEDEELLLPKKGKRKKRANSCSSDKAEEQPWEQHKGRTKAEMQAAEKWYEQFNSMCKEIDEYELEIE